MSDLFADSEPAEPAEPTTRKSPGAARASRAIHVSGYDREARDFYATPDWVREALLRHVPLRGRVWEPCCGDGAISKVLQRRGYEVTSSDIADRGFGTSGVDFLSCRSASEGCRAIVTNPPYGDAGSRAGQEKSSLAMLHFVRHALRLTESMEGRLALLVRFQWVAGMRASALMSAGPFAAVVALTRRVQWFDRGAEANLSQHHHAWVVFDHAHPVGQPPVLLFADDRPTLPVQARLGES